MATDETDISKEINRINSAKDKIKSNFVTLGISNDDSDISQLAEDSDTLPTFFEDLTNRVVPITKGGTGATTAAAARTNLGVAATAHKHSAADINSGTIDAARLPTVNDLTSDSTTAPLSAAQGKALKEAIDGSVHPLDQITTSTAASVDSYTKAGLYWLVKTTVTDTPNGGSGMLIVTTSRTGNVIYQTFVSFNTGSGYVATRCYTNSQWYPWDERPAPASYVTQEGTSGAWRYRIWSDGKKECWLKTSIQHEVKQASGSLYYSTTVPYPYPVTFTNAPMVYVGVRSPNRSPNNKPIWAIPSTPASGANTKANAYMEFVTTTSTNSITTDIYIYACGV